MLLFVKYLSIYFSWNAGFALDRKLNGKVFLLFIKVVERDLWMTEEKGDQERFCLYWRDSQTSQR